MRWALKKAEVNYLQLYNKVLLSVVVLSSLLLPLSLRPMLMPPLVLANSLLRLLLQLLTGSFRENMCRECKISQSPHTVGWSVDPPRRAGDRGIENDTTIKNTSRLFGTSRGVKTSRIKRVARSGEARTRCALHYWLLACLGQSSSCVGVFRGVWKRS